MTEHSLPQVDVSKAFDNLTHEELIALTDEQIQFYIDKACAEEGVPLLPPSAPVKPDVVVVPKTVTHYVVAGVRFLVESEARAVAAAINRSQSRRALVHMGTYRWSDPVHDAPEQDEVLVTTEQVFDANGAAAHKAETDQKADRLKAYEDAKKAYDAALTGRDNVGQSIRATVSKAWRLESRRQELLREYDRYKPLANGDELVAKRFLQRAHGDAREVLPSLFPIGWNDEPARAADAQPEEVAF